MEYQFDPLTQVQCRINPARAKRVKQTGDVVNLSGIIARTGETCPFCLERVEEKTPKLLQNVCQEGRIKLGETLIFPNLNPVGENHAVGIISRAHFPDLDAFSTRMLEDNLIASKKCILSVYGNDKQAIWSIYI